MDNYNSTSKNTLFFVDSEFDKSTANNCVPTIKA